MLHGMGVLSFSPPLDGRIKRKEIIESGHSWEIQIRGTSCYRLSHGCQLCRISILIDIGCTIHAVELIRQEIVREHPDAEINAILIDFFLYDSLKDMEKDGALELIPHHRTRSIWY